MHRVNTVGNPPTEVENVSETQAVAPVDRPAAAALPLPDVPALAEHGPKVWLVRWMCGVFALLGVATVAVTWTVTENHWSNGWLAIVFGIGIAILQIMPVKLSHEGQGESLHLEEAFLVAAALFLSPFEALMASGGAVLVGHICHRRGVLKTSFNTGVFVMS